jgi:hypothetical protein
MINGGRWKDGGCPISANVLRVMSWLEMDGCSSLSNEAVLDNHCTSNDGSSGRSKARDGRDDGEMAFDSATARM